MLAELRIYILIYPKPKGEEGILGIPGWSLCVWGTVVRIKVL
jgi:hypothetical protein